MSHSKTSKGDIYDIREHFRDLYLTVQISIVCEKSKGEIKGTRPWKLSNCHYRLSEGQWKW